MRTYVRVPRYGYTVTEHDRERPWIVRGTEHYIVELDTGQDFFTWAAERWPGERFTVQLDPWALSPRRPRLGD